MKIVFFGSSEFSVPCLEFVQTPPRELLAVVTTPDQPKGRGLHLGPNPVKAICDAHKVLTFTPRSLKEPEAEKKIAELKPDFFIVASYGKMIPSSWLGIPRKAAWNIHPSLLPKYRGAAPIVWQILNGEKETGLTLALVTPELDAGDIVHQIRIPLGPEETTESLTRRLSELAARALEAAFQKYELGTLHLTPQDASASNYAKKLIKEDGHLHLSESAAQLERKVRAFQPWPGTFVGYKKEPLRVVEATLDSIDCSEAKPGTLLEINTAGHLRIQTGKGSLKILKVQLPGRRVISGSEFANGQRLKPGFQFESLQ